MILTVSVCVCVCRGEVASSLNRDNPLYESQEIRMEMFADVQSEDEEGKYLGLHSTLTCTYCLIHPNSR